MGDDVELALKDVAAATIGHLGLIGEAAAAPKQRGKSGNDLYGAYGHDFTCADGKQVMIVGLTARQWALIVKVTKTEAAMQALENETQMCLVRRRQSMAIAASDHGAVKSVVCCT